METASKLIVKALNLKGKHSLAFSSEGLKEVCEDIRHALKHHGVVMGSPTAKGEPWTFSHFCSGKLESTVRVYGV